MAGNLRHAGAGLALAQRMLQMQHMFAIGFWAILAVSLPVPVQTVNEGAYRIRDFRLRFYASESMWQPAQEVDTVSPMCCLRTAGVAEWEERSGCPFIMRTTVSAGCR